MKALIVSTFVVLFASGAYAQSRSGGAAGLGTFKGGKQGFASVKDLNRASTLAAQAQARTGWSNHSKGSGWAQGGGGWGASQKRNR